MTVSTDRHQAAYEALSRWRARSADEKRRARRAVVVEHVVNSMAMEAEPVSQAWIQQATSRRA